MDLVRKAASNLKTPLALKKDHKFHYHSHELNDEYFWLSNIEDPKVMDYIIAENSYADSILDSISDLQNEIYEEFKTRLKENDESIPEKVDNYFYYERNEKNKQYEILCRKKDSLTAAEEIYLDLNERKEKYVDLGDTDISPDHNMLIYSLDFVGNENYNLFIKNLVTKEEKVFSNENLGGFVCFANNSIGLFFDELNKVNVPSKVFFAPDLFHNPNELIKLFDEPDETKDVYFYKTKDKKYLIIGSDDKDSTECYFLDLNDKIVPDNIRLFTKRKPNVIYHVYHNHNHFYILTNANNCINFKIMRVKDEFFHEKENWEVFLAHDENVQLEYVEMFENFIVVHIRKNGIKNIKFYDIKKNIWREIETLPEEVHTINYHEAPDNNEYYTNKLRFYYTSLITPASTFDYDMENYELRLLKIKDIKNYTREEYKQERIFIKAKDDTAIPVSLFYKNSLDITGGNPLLLYGYGAYGLSTEPGFSPYALSLVERGFIYGIAHVRGGGEFGRQWYEAGKYDKKMNTFTDFISCIEYLIDKNYTKPDKLAIRGGSAGGLLVGAVVNMVPHMIKTAVMSSPFLDVVNTMNDVSIPLTTLEFYEYGNPIESEEVLERLLAFSPYDNLKKLEFGSYPNIFVMTSLNDSRVGYWEPVKYIAKLRSLKSPSDSNLLLLMTNLEAGHSGASGKYDYLKELSLEYTFILSTINN